MDRNRQTRGRYSIGALICNLGISYALLFFNS
uniref:Uncharacterized protein n=1 Tax=Anguilla anguilla TaxID=7936 RepID=A0A0E9UKK3_ANGAN